MPDQNHPSKPDLEVAAQYMALFEGYDKAQGNFTPTEFDQTGKMLGISKTYHRAVTVEDWHRHLRGEKPGIGVIPLKANNTVRWAAIDIDDKKIDHKNLEEEINALNLPLVVCRSRSGGAHVFVFFSEDADAAAAQEGLGECAALLGHAGVEIFPKQVERSKEVSVGNWLNMPYYGGIYHDRYGFRDGASLSALNFLEYANSKKVTADYFALTVRAANGGAKKKTRAPQAGPKPEEQDAPPPNPPGGRNDFLFRAACLLMRQNWPLQVVETSMLALNTAATTEQHANFCEGPLPERELQALLKSAHKYADKSDAGGVVLSPEEATDSLNEKHAIVRESGKTAVFEESYDSGMRRWCTFRSSFADIKNFYSQLVKVRKNGEDAFRKQGEFWLNHHRARRFKGVVFDPKGESSPTLYNLWRGYGVEPQPGSWDLFKNHLMNNVCSSNREYYDYFIGWLARMFQRPTKPGEVAIVLKGERGTGKTFVGKTIAKLYGQHGLILSNTRHLVGNFNAHLRDVIFLLAEEAFWAGDHAADGVLKTLITGPTILIEKKGIDAYEVPNYLHIMMTSNSSWVIPAGDHERRYFVLEVGDGNRQDRSYFSEIDKELENGGYGGLLHYLLHYDISKFDVGAVPKTEELVEQWIESMPPEAAWWYERLRDGWQNLCRADQVKELWPAEIPSRLVFEDFSKGREGHVNRSRATETKLGIFLRKNVPGLRRETRMRETVYIFPTQQKCREAFQKGMPITWPEMVYDAVLGQDDLPL